MSARPASTGGRVGLAALGVLCIGFAAWSALGLWFQVPGAWPLRALGIGLWLATLFAALLVPARRRVAFGVFALLAAGFLAGWFSLTPRLDRDWAPDVARTVTGRVDGDTATLFDVRDFRWRTEDEAEEAWETREYDLSQLVEADLVLSYWGIDAIAHTLVSFGFADGRRVVFSVEIRRERTEEFSSIAGFFRAYELALIASEEADILYLRTNARGEDTYLYPLDLRPEALRALFATYVDAGNGLARKPRFYNTLTANCTTVIFDLARLIEPGIPLDWRVLLSGYLPGYLVDHDALQWTDADEAEARRRAAISARARAAAGETPYSEAIRAPL